MSVHNLAGFRFLQRMAATKAKADELVKAANKANVTLTDINAKLAENIAAQRILNQHLSRRVRTSPNGKFVLHSVK